jgi:hypothetical protein
MTTRRKPVSSTSPGGLTETSPGQTARVAAIVKRNNAAAKPVTGTGDGEVIEPLGRAAAEFLDKQLMAKVKTARRNLADLAELVRQAKAGQIHAALGWPSWTAYLADRLGGQLDLKLDVETRREVVEMLAGEGMSNRAIAASTGVSEPTVRRDRAADEQVRHDDAPERQAHEAAPAATVTGLDGKRHPAKKPEKPAGGGQDGQPATEVTIKSVRLD